MKKASFESSNLEGNQELSKDLRKIKLLFIVHLSVVLSVMLGFLMVVYLAQ